MRSFIDNWKNFTHVDVELRQRAFLVGPNAAGKSNLLDAVRFLRDVVTEGGGFAQAVKTRGGVSAVRCLAARRRPEVGVAVTVGSDRKPSTWTYELRFGQDKKRRPVLTRERVSKCGRTVIDRPEPEDESDPERLRQTSLEQVNVNRPYREVAEFLRSVRYLHISHCRQVPRDQQIYLWSQVFLAESNR